MAYASTSGRARTSSKSPRAFAVCMRCGFWYNRDRLQFQNAWRGASVINTYKLVCPPCLDQLQEQLRAITLPADPVPIFYPSVEDFAGDETDYRAVSKPPVIDRITGIPIPSTTLRVTEDCQNRTLIPFGRPEGMDQNAVMPYNGVVQKAFGVPLQILSVISNGTATINVTCSAVHGLQPLSQVSVQGLADNNADGFYTVKVLTATAFSYMTYGAIGAASLLTPTSRIITALIGLPLGYKVIPKIYGPNLFPEVEAAVCFLEMEDGTSMFMLESGGGFVQLEQCMQPPLDTFYFEFETGDGVIQLENGQDFLEQEIGP